MPQNSTIIPSLFYHLSSSFRVHHYPPIIINAPSFRLNHSYHLSSSFRVHHSPPIITMCHHSISMISTYHCHFAPYHLSSSLRHLYHYNFAIIPHLLFATYHHSTFIIYHFHNHPSIHHLYISITISLSLATTIF